MIVGLSYKNTGSLAYPLHSRSTPSNDKILLELARELQPPPHCTPGQRNFWEEEMGRFRRCVSAGFVTQKEALAMLAWLERPTGSMGNIW